MNIVIIGVGALGKRHLQSLLELKQSHIIYAVEVNEEAINVLKDEMPAAYYISNIAQLPKEIEVAVIATGSNVRRKVFEDLVGHCKVKNIVFEKVLFQKEEDYYFVQEKLHELGINAWVNCARREWDSYKDFRKELLNCREMHITAIGGEWGLGCNAIHLLDLIEFLAGDKVEKIDIDKLENGICESRRKGFYEFYGTLTGRAGKCRNFNITCIKHSSLPFYIEIYTDVARYIIDEGKNLMTFASSDAEWKFTEKEFKQVYQSQMTGRVVQSIINDGTCNLSKYDSAMELHLKYIKSLIVFFTANGMEGDICPIT